MLYAMRHALCALQYKGMNMKISETIGLIGVGNMGTAILEGLFAKKIAAPSQVVVYDKIKEKVQEFSNQYGVLAASSNADLASRVEVLLLAIKPQDLAATSLEIKPALKASKILISILAGTPVRKIQEHLGTNLDIIRAMPNLGAKVGESLTALTGSGRALSIAEAVFSGCGKTIQLDEKYFDLITALSGSGPAYFFYLMELMAKEGCERGLSESQAKLVAVQTALGSALLAAQSLEDPAVLRQRVTSKGGTTEAALKELVKALPQSFHDAIQAAYDRGRELGQS